MLELNGVAYIDRPVGVLGEDRNHHRQVPRVLRVVLTAVRRSEGRLTKDGLELVDLDEKSELGMQSIIEVVGEGRLLGK